MKNFADVMSAEIKRVDCTVEKDVISQIIHSSKSVFGMPSFDGARNSPSI